MSSSENSEDRCEDSDKEYISEHEINSLSEWVSVSSDEDGSDEDSRNDNSKNEDSRNEDCSDEDCSNEDSSDEDAGAPKRNVTISTPVTIQQSNQTALQTLIEPLEDGLLSFNRLSEMLLSTDKEIITPDSQIFNDFRQEIKAIEANFEKSKQIASEELQVLDKKTESLTADKNVLERKKKKQDAKLKKLKAFLDLEMSKLKKYNEAQKRQEKKEEYAIKILEEKEKDKKHAKIVRNAGIGVGLIPIVGWIAGPIMIGVGAAKLNSARKQIESVYEEVEEWEFEEDRITEKISTYNERISAAEKETEKINSRILETEAELKALSEKRKTVADLQSKTREVFRHLGLLSGVGSAAEKQTKRQILVETIMKVTNELTPVLTQIIGDGLLATECFKSIVQDIQTYNGKLKAIIGEENEDFY